MDRSISTWLRREDRGVVSLSLFSCSPLLLPSLLRSELSSSLSNRSGCPCWLMGGCPLACGRTGPRAGESEFDDTSAPLPFVYPGRPPRRVPSSNSSTPERSLVHNSLDLRSLRRPPPSTSYVEPFKPIAYSRSGMRSRSSDRRLGRGKSVRGVWYSSGDCVERVRFASERVKGDSAAG